MTTLILAVALLLPPFPGVPTLSVSVPAPIVQTETHGGTRLPATGWATYYGDGIFEQVLANQLRYDNIQPDTCPACVGNAAMLWPEDLDRIVCLLTEDGREYGPLWVVDSAASQHRQALIDSGWVVDLEKRVHQDVLGLPNAPTLVTVTGCTTP